VRDEALELTEEGERALQQGCLDPLDRALFDLSPNLVDLRAAAWAAVAAGNPEILSLAAHGPGEIVARAWDRAGGPSASDVAARARDLSLAVDRVIAGKRAQGRPPSAQDVADAIRVAEIVVRDLLLGEQAGPSGP
jgi:hypothetical protein